MPAKIWTAEEGEKLDKSEMRFVSCDFEIKAAHPDDDDDPKKPKGVLEGFASVFGNIDEVGDIVMEGAFAKTISESKGKVPILSNHNPHKQIGFGTEAEEKRKGLFVKGILEINDIPEAKAHFALAKRAKEIGAKAGLSFGFNVVKFEFDHDTGIRKLKELKLHEWSPVTFPANLRAATTAAKSWLDVYSKAHGNPDLNEYVTVFIDYLRNNGHNDIEIYKALNAAAVSGDPSKSKIAQSLDEKIQELKTMLST